MTFKYLIDEFFFYFLDILHAHEWYKKSNLIMDLLIKFCI